MPAVIEARGADRLGRVYNAANDGLAYIAEEGTKNLYSFTFDRIEGYRGETIEELKLDTNRRVRFRLTKSRQVSRVWL